MNTRFMMKLRVHAFFRHPRRRTHCRRAGRFPLKLSDNHRYLVDQNGKPFLMVGDTPQGLMGRLTEQDAEYYFADREAHGFNTLGWIDVMCAGNDYKTNKDAHHSRRHQAVYRLRGGRHRFHPLRSEQAQRGVLHAARSHRSACRQASPAGLHRSHRDHRLAARAAQQRNEGRVCVRAIPGQSLQGLLPTWRGSTETISISGPYPRTTTWCRPSPRASAPSAPDQLQTVGTACAHQFVVRRSALDSAHRLERHLHLFAHLHPDAAQLQPEAGRAGGT